MVHAREDAAAGVALVTGAARRIGRSIAKDLAAHGWAVVAHYWDSAEDARTLTAEIESAGGRVASLQADLADEAQVRGLAQAAGEPFGAVDLLVNNASVFINDGILDSDRRLWDLHMAVNLRAPLVLIEEFARRLPAERPGNVVNILDQRVWSLTHYFMSYTVSQTGLWTLTRTLAMALAPRIRVNAVGPGPTLKNERQTDAQFTRQWQTVPLRRPTAPEEIAEAIRYIVAAPAMTGQMIALDGGQHLGWAQPDW